MALPIFCLHWYFVMYPCFEREHAERGVLHSTSKLFLRPLHTLHFLICSAVLDTMRREGIAANTVTYTALISAQAKDLQWEAALEVFAEMKSAGIAERSCYAGVSVLACPCWRIRVGVSVLVCPCWRVCVGVSVFACPC